MRAVAYAPAIALATLSCASAAPLAVPPVVDIPTPPAARAFTRPVDPPALPQAAPWIERVERSEKTKVVAACQISPFSFASVMVVENRVLGAGRFAIRVVQDDESAKGVEALPGLLGKGYVVDKTDGTLRVHDGNGGAVPDDASRRIAALASAYLGWPGGDVASHLPAVGAEVQVLEPSVISVASVPLHGDLTAQESKATVRYAGIKKGDDGDELSFDVELVATEGDAGMCHRWTNEAHTKGELRIRAAGGALLGLHLYGTTQDTEGVCQGASGGPPPPSHTCNRGDVTIEVRQPHVP